MTTETQTQSTEAAAVPAGFVKESFFFREKKEKGIVVEPKRDTFETIIPALTAESLLTIILEGLENDAEGNVVASEKGASLLRYLADKHNDTVYSEAQSQINDKLASFSDVANRIAYKLTDADIDQSKLDLWYLVNKPKATRGAGKLFSDELIADAIESYKSIGQQVFKKGDGTPTSLEVIMKGAEETFTHKFKNFKTSKPHLELFKSRVILWLANVPEEQTSKFEPLAKHLLEKLDAYLNPKAASTLDAFE